MIIKLTKDTEVEGRLYLAGQSHDFSHATAERLISDESAVHPSVFSEKTNEPNTKVETVSNVDSSTLTITDLDGDEIIVTSVIEPAPATPKAKRRK